MCVCVCVCVCVQCIVRLIKNYSKRFFLYYNDFVPCSEALGTPRTGLCSQSINLWATSDLVPHFEALGTPPKGRDYVVIPPNCGPVLMFSPALNRWGPHKR